MISIICWQIVYISKTVAIYDRSCQQPEVVEGGGGLDDKSKPGIWFLNQFKTDAMATFSFLTDSVSAFRSIGLFFSFQILELGYTDYSTFVSYSRDKH